MTQTEMDITARKAAAYILDLFEEEQPTGFIALELIVSSRVMDAVRPDTKLARAIRLAERDFSAGDDFWKETASSLSRIIERTRAELQRCPERDAKERLILDLLGGDPDYLRTLSIPDT